MADKFLPYVRFWPKDFLASIGVQTMSVEEVGGYCLLLFNAWLQRPQGTLPNDEETLRKVCRMTPEQWGRHSQAILGHWGHQDDQDNRLFNERLLEEKAKQSTFSATLSEAGKRGAAKRWDAEKRLMARPCDGHKGANGQGMARPCDGHKGANGQGMASHIHSHHQKTPPPRVPPAGGETREEVGDEKKGHRLPAGFSDEFVAAWKAAGISRVLSFGKDRTQLLSRRYQLEFFREGWREALDRASKIPGVCKARRCDVDWFLREKTVRRLLEGFYDGWTAKEKETPRSTAEQREEELRDWAKRAVEYGDRKDEPDDSRTEASEF